MARYYIVADNGDWLEADENAPGANAYDEDAAAEHVQILVSRVKTWNKVDIRDLLSVLDQIPEALRDAGRAPRTADVIDYSDLPTEEIPNGLETYPIWAMDTRGQCLVGDTADKIEDIVDIKVWYEERKPTGAE